MTVHEEQKLEDEEGCSYAWMTCVAIAVTIVSAALTFLIANHMYMGTEDTQKQLYTGNRINWLTAEFFAAPGHKFDVYRCAITGICYLVPTSVKTPHRLHVLSDILDYDLLQSLVGPSISICSPSNTFVTRSLDNNSIKDENTEKCVDSLLLCNSSLIGQSNSCRVSTHRAMLSECDKTVQSH